MCLGISYSYGSPRMYIHNKFWTSPPVTLSHANWIISPARRTYKGGRKYHFLCPHRYLSKYIVKVLSKAASIIFNCFILVAYFRGKNGQIWVSPSSILQEPIKLQYAQGTNLLDAASSQGPLRIHHSRIEQGSFSILFHTR